MESRVYLQVYLQVDMESRVYLPMYLLMDGFIGGNVESAPRGKIQLYALNPFRGTNHP
jgi:hypothetical protein